MNDLGMTLIWCAFQVSLVLAPALVLHAVAARRCPASGSWVASMSLGLVVAMSLGIHSVRREDDSSMTLGASSARIARINQVVNTRDVDQHRDDLHPGSVPPGEGPAWSISKLQEVWERVERGAAAPVSGCRPWGRVLAVVFMAGTGLGPLRLFVGLWAVEICRRRGRLVDDPGLLHIVEELRAAMGCLREVEVREVIDLTTPATAGWWRAVVLLPEDWRSWDEHERQAVLAHELAHICRADYAAGLVARLAVILHFYHPLVHWLAARLQLQQELAADSIGATFAGGKGRYLQSLSRLALRQDGRFPGWLARAFLPAGGTLIRRIAMLRNETLSTDRAWSGSRRILATLVLLTVAAGAASLRGPASGRGVGDANGGPSAITADGQAKGDREEFDLSYVPEDAMGLVAIRPSVLFQRAGMAPFAAQANKALALWLAQVGEDLSLDAAGSKASPIQVESIEQATFGVWVENKDVTTRPNRQIIFGGLALRMTRPFDWVAQFRAWKMDPTEVREGDRVYYTLKNGSWLGPKPCFFCPDERTLIVNEEKVVQNLMKRAAPTAPEYARGKDWDRVSRGVLAVALDNRDGRWTRAFKGSDAEDVGLAAVVEQADVWTLGLADADEFSFQAIATCADADTADTTVRAVEAVLATCRKLTDQLRPDALRGEKAEAALIRSLHVEREARSVVLRSSNLGKLADFIATIEDLDGAEDQPSP